MTDIPDRELLAEFARSESEAAFAELVRRHIALVHSVALRYTDNPQSAQEITQAVFIILARKAGSFGRGAVLGGWLHHTARLMAANFRRAEFRRLRREQESFMQSTIEEVSPDATWAQLAPILDEAVSHLGETDRAAVVLRYFENKSLAEVGTALGASEDAAKKRVTRALEKLRKILAKRGVTLTAAVIAGAVAANSVQAAPAGLAIKISAVAVAKGAAAGTTTIMLVKGALKFMAWSKAKPAIVVCTGILIAAGVATLTLTSMPFPKPVPPVAEPSRVMNQIAEPLDLSAYYEQDQGLPYGPQGLQTFEHVPLQIDGMMLLWGANNAKSGAVFAEELSGITVNRKFETLYVYQATFYGALEQEPVYDLVFRYEDGSSATNAILYDEDVLDFYINKGPAELGPIGPRSKLVWLGQLAYGEKKQRIRFFLTAVENPQPSLKVVTIDLYSCKTTAAACIQAMTTGPSGLMQ